MNKKENNKSNNKSNNKKDGIPSFLYLIILFLSGLVYYIFQIYIVLYSPITILIIILTILLFLLNYFLRRNLMKSKKFKNNTFLKVMNLSMYIINIIIAFIYISILLWWIIDLIPHHPK